MKSKCSVAEDVIVTGGDTDADRKKVGSKKLTTLADSSHAACGPSGLSLHLPAWLGNNHTLIYHLPLLAPCTFANVLSGMFATQGAVDSRDVKADGD